MEMNDLDRERLIRIDERTELMHDALTKHFEDDREDFKEVHHRINRISGKQNWLISLTAIVGGLVGGFGAWFNSGG